MIVNLIATACMLILARLTYPNKDPEGRITNVNTKVSIDHFSKSLILNSNYRISYLYCCFYRLCDTCSASMVS